jgi:sodium-independent sulfate anion transporter 11
MILPQLPAIVMILIIEHIAIAKSFGRIFNYKVDPSQEMCAQGAANLFSPFVGGYTCTGSFGASAVLSKAGVKTPLAGLFSALILILALYALTSVFYYIPMAALAGLIIHAVYNLATPPKTLHRYWQVSPFEFFIWIIGVAAALFSSLEVSIYVTIALSFVLLLLRVARSEGRFMGRVRVHDIYGDENQEPRSAQHVDGDSSKDDRDAYLPLDRKDGSNPEVNVQCPYPGVFIYRFTEGFSYVNQALYMDSISSYITKNTRPARSDDGIATKASQSPSLR